MRRRRARLAAVVVLLLLAGPLACAWLPLSPRREGCPVVPVSSAQLPPDASLRAKVEMRIDDREIGFEVVARTQSEQLIVVGLAPYGARLFSVQQRGTELEVDAGSSRRLRHLALWVMDALHRAYWIGPAAVPRSDDGSTDFVWAGERVSESREGGGRRRTYTRVGSGSAAPGVTIDYPPESVGGPERALKIHSAWCGYDAAIAILDDRSE